jgi:hypothetical protein
MWRGMKPDPQIKHDLKEKFISRIFSSLVLSPSSSPEMQQLAELFTVLLSVSDNVYSEVPHS